MKYLLYRKNTPQDADYTVVALNEDGKIMVKAPVITIIFKDSEGNEISSKTYKYGETVEVPTAPTKEGYTFLGWGDVQIDKAIANMIFIAQYEVTPKVTIAMSDTYTDGSSIALNATKTETVTGELQFTTDLASDIAHIEDNVLIFDKHYEGTINILASALDKHSNIQSDSKSITVSCDVADTVKCVVSNVTAEDVEADATSAIIKYDCNVTTTTHAGVSNTVVTHKEKTVTFEANASSLNLKKLDVINHFTYVITDNLDLTNGLSSEAVAIAGNLKLKKLIVLNISDEKEFNEFESNWMGVHFPDDKRII